MLKQDVWQFNVGKGKHTTKVCVHLDLAEEPSQNDIVNSLVKYIAIMEEIKAQERKIIEADTNKKGCVA